MRSTLLAIVVVLLLFGGSGVAVAEAKGITDCDFTRNLMLGSRGEDVACFQNYLKSQPAANWPAGQAATGYFGSITEDSQFNWQIANGIMADVEFLAMFASESDIQMQIDALLNQIRSLQSILRRQEDLQRWSNVSALGSSIALYQATTESFLPCVPGKVYRSNEGTTAVDGTGWLPIDFRRIPGGSPLSALPTASRNDPSYYDFYAYECGYVHEQVWEVY
ncbi:MAG: hypothetical protein Q8Q92_02285 [bacterium]|nr:hypothetical protein [bacterium]